MNRHQLAQQIVARIHAMPTESAADIWHQVDAVEALIRDNDENRHDVLFSFFLALIFIPSILIGIAIAVLVP